MTHDEVKQQIKNEALKKIAKIYHSLYKFPYSYYEEDGSFAEQREHQVDQIIKDMNKKLEALKLKKKNEHTHQ